MSELVKRLKDTLSTCMRRKGPGSETRLAHRATGRYEEKVCAEFDTLNTFSRSSVEPGKFSH